MLVSLNWLKEYVDLPDDVNDLAERLTALGLEVEGVQPVNRGLEGIVAGRILEVKEHPQADKLSVCVVDDGEQEPKDVVCGAPNARPGLVSVFAPMGVTLPVGIKLKKTKIRGVESRGMLCAEDELGVSADHSIIMELPDDMAPGTEIAPIFADTVFDVGITPNRPDCLCMIGVAREVAAAYGLTVRYPADRPPETGALADERTSVTIEAPDACPRYVARLVSEVKIGDSPLWMRLRLIAAGLRPISNVVDVTNYILMELGQPLHAFDFNLLDGRRIVVKYASEGDRFTTLDDEERILGPADLMICDAEHQVALAGIMGGINSEIAADTKDVLIESAFFEPMGIRRSAKRLGMSTEASFRFERGIDIEGSLTACNRAALLMAELAGGQVAKGVVDAYPKPYKPLCLNLSVSGANRYLGINLDADRMAEHLRSIELEVNKKDDDQLEVIPPPFRVDLVRPVDLTEEVARLVGFDAVPATLPSGAIAARPRTHNHLVRSRAREAMAGLGYSEVITYSYASSDDADKLGLPGDHPGRRVVRLINPLSEDQSVLRTDLIAGQLRTLRRNLAFKVGDVRLFEWGRAFRTLEGQDLPDEPIILAGTRAGLGAGKAWHYGERQVDFYDLAGDVEELAEALGLEDLRLTRTADNKAPEPWLDPTQSAAIFLNNRYIGWVGRISPNILEAFDVTPPRAFGFSLMVEQFIDQALTTPEFKALPRYPDVVWDVAFVVNKGVESEALIRPAIDAGVDILGDVRVFDVYEGKPMEAGERSVGLRFTYRSPDRTLTEEEVAQVHHSLVSRIVEATGARLRFE